MPASAPSRRAGTCAPRPPPRRRRTTPAEQIARRHARAAQRRVRASALRARRGLHAAHCKNDDHSCATGPSPALRRGRGASGVPRNGAPTGASRSTTRGLAAATVARRAAVARLAPEKRREGVLFRRRGIGELRGRRGRAGGRSFTARRCRTRPNGPASRRRSTSRRASTLPPRTRPFFDLIFDINEPIRKMAAGPCAWTACTRRTSPMRVSRRAPSTGRSPRLRRAGLRAELDAAPPRCWCRWGCDGDLEVPGDVGSLGRAT